MQEIESVKAEYTETEAAQALGITREQLRALVRSYVTSEESEIANVAMVAFRPADLLLLKMLVQRDLTATVPH